LSSSCINHEYAVEEWNGAWRELDVTFMHATYNNYNIGLYYRICIYVVLDPIITFATACSWNFCRMFSYALGLC